MKKIINTFLFLFLAFFSLSSINAADNENFILDTVEPISFTEVKLSFNSILEEGDDVIREFKIFNKYDSFDELYVLEAELDSEDKSILNLTFSNEALAGEEYELIIIDLTDEFGRNIESGIDGIQFFIMPDVFAEIDTTTEVVTDTPAETEVVVIDTPVEIEVAVTEEVELNSALGTTDNVVTGENMNENDIEKNVLSESKEVKKLPETGTGHLLIFALSFLLAILIFVLRVKKYN